MGIIDTWYEAQPSEGGFISAQRVNTLRRWCHANAGREFADWNHHWQDRRGYVWRFRLPAARMLFTLVWS